MICWSIEIDADDVISLKESGFNDDHLFSFSDDHVLSLSGQVFFASPSPSLLAVEQLWKKRVEDAWKEYKSTDGIVSSFEHETSSDIFPFQFVISNCHTQAQLGSKTYVIETTIKTYLVPDEGGEKDLFELRLDRWYTRVFFGNMPFPYGKLAQRNTKGVDLPRLGSLAELDNRFPIRDFVHGWGSMKSNKERGFPIERLSSVARTHYGVYDWLIMSNLSGSSVGSQDGVL